MSAFRAARRLLTAVPGRRASTGIRIASPRRLLHVEQQPTLLRTYNSSASRQNKSANSKRDDSQHEDKDHPPQTIPSQFEKKANTRSATSKSTFRRVASNDRTKSANAGTDGGARLPTQICTAYCTAEKYNLRQCNSLLKSGGYVPDPLSTGLGDEVIHLRLPLPPQAYRHFPKSLGPDSYGDIFVFPSGNIVSWGLPEAISTSVAALIRPAAESPHSTTETETLEYVEDPNRSTCFLRGDVIIIGTGINKLLEEDTHIIHIGGIDSLGGPVIERKVLRHEEEEEEGSRRQTTPTVLAKIAFSSGMARSTKLAVLEEMLESYIESTSSIPKLLSQGSRLPFTRSFILRKTGELLSFRARLNLYSELTDNLPDIFWDSRKELGLEGYYESVGRELDVGVRIKKLNEKLDYASEMAAVLRERLSERHGLVLEWMIIILITIEVGFEILHLWKDSKEEQRREEELERQNAPPQSPYPPPTRPTFGYQNYPHHDYHQHHQHRYPQPPPQRLFEGTQQTPQQYQQYPPSLPHPQAASTGRMDEIDVALTLLEGVIAKVTAAEEERRKKAQENREHD
ncbi:hypothetical protein H072_1251 [Dactylellina haptotyla CBS 200.50]|uniref:DUF155 domain-containing protein n=1 Tax=Dactylellina haptotyla (strain CBS 200.50) TaxID=1284197 RepID=S8CAI1_DACHA|nr:hypothetical protein H072_1251 [Dactylellina haptotyla CBS 200.50]